MALMQPCRPVFQGLQLLKGGVVLQEDLKPQSQKATLRYTTTRPRSADLSSGLPKKLHHCFVSFAGALVFCLFLNPFRVHAQSASLLVGSATGSAGAPVDLPVSFTAGATPVSTVQFDLTLPSSLSYVSVTTGSSAAAAGKSAQANGNSSGVRVLVFGLNQTAIGSGPIAIVRLNVASGTAAGTVPVGISGIVASDPGALAVPVSGIGCSVAVGTTPTINFTQISLSDLSNDSVTINWNTDQPTTGSIDYGTSSVTQLSSPELNLSTDHKTHLGGLSPSTVYSYRVTARDARGNQASSGVLMFKTTSSASQPARPSSDASFISQVIENASFRTNLGINNHSSTVANVAVTLVDVDGMVLGSKTLVVEPGGLKQTNSVAQYLYDSLGGETQGNLYLESDQAISAWASQIDNGTNDPSMLVSKRVGATKILVPSAANTSTFKSSLVLMNVGLGVASVAIKAYDVNGAVLGQTSSNFSIPPNGVLSFDNVLESLGVVNNFGPIEITSSNDIPLIAASRVSSTSKAGGFFEGLRYSDASLVQVIPHVVDTPELRTNIGINNVTDSTATVMVRLFNKDGVELGAASVIVSAKGLSQINHVIRSLMNRSDLTNVEGYIRLESNQPIFGWASQIDNLTNDPGFAVSKAQGASKLLVQSTTNVGTFRSSLVVVNLGSAPAVVDIVSRDTEGRVTGETRGVSIPTAGFFSTANILQSLGVAANFGPVELISTNGQPLVATSRVYSTSGTSGFFEGQALE
jgi:hypothetical protein